MKKLLPILLLASCSKIPYVPATPIWDADACLPSSDEYLDLARSTEDRPPPLNPDTPPAEARAEAQAWVESMGFTLKIGRPPGFDWVAKPDADFCATTIPPHVWMSQECFDRKGDDHQEWTVMWRHEGTHAAQWHHHGALMPLYYGLTEGRLLAIEGPAYAETYATRRAQGFEVSDATLRKRALKVYDQYQGHVATIPEHCYVQHAMEIWK